MYKIIKDIPINADGNTPWITIKELIGFTIQGNGHTIGTQKYPLNAPLIAIGGELIVCNLEIIICSEVKSGDPSEWGALMIRGENCELTNVTTNGVVTAAGVTLAGLGGIVGVLLSSTVTKGVNYIDIHADTPAREAGGIAGTADDSLFSMCVNNSVEIIGNEYAGGIVGISYHSAFRSCVNNSRVSTNPDSYSVNSRVGGIVGAMHHTAASFQYMEILDCVNHGAIGFGEGEFSTYSGGIAVMISTAFLHAPFTLNIINNVNSCNVYGEEFVGGIIGSLNCGRVPNYLKVNVLQNENLGSVLRRAAAACAADSGVGGIIGHSGLGAVVTHNRVCAETIGDTEDAAAKCSNVGGIVGGTLASGSCGATTISSNMTDVKTLRGLDNVNRIAGRTNGAESNLLADNYAAAKTAIISNAVNNGTVNEKTDPQYGADKLHGANIETKPVPEGYEYTDCLRLERTDCANATDKLTTSGGAFYALSSVVQSVARMEDGLAGLIEAGACSLLDGLERVGDKSALVDLNTSVTNIVDSSSILGDFLMKKYGKATEYMKAHLELCGCDGEKADGRVCVTIYAAAEGSLQPSPDVVYHVKNVTAGKDLGEYTTDQTGKISVMLDPENQYTFTSDGGGLWMPDVRTVYVYTDGSYRISGARSGCCNPVTIYLNRPDELFVDETEVCVDREPFAPTCV
ncbi:MAG: hypothetical protein LBD16_05140 [Oscillospiraceae bacterium]|nr:hypothetical protein [Oscillospiraceae bacterium]